MTTRKKKEVTGQMPERFKALGDATKTADLLRFIAAEVGAAQSDYERQCVLRDLTDAADYLDQ